MQLTPYLIFNGNCEAAFRFYEKTLGGKIQMMMKNGESPMAGETPPQMRDKIMHVCMSLGEGSLMGSDSPEARYEKPQGTWVSIQVKEPAEAERIYNAFADGGTVCMPLQKTFWALKFGMVTDRFGTPWMINCSDPAMNA